MADELNENAEFGRKHKNEEDPILVAQRFLNIYRQMHIFNEARRNEFDAMLLKMPSDIRLLLSTLPGGSLLIEHIEELEQKNGIHIDTPYPNNAAGLKKNLNKTDTTSTQAPATGVVIDSSFATELSSSLSMALQQTERRYKEDIRTLTETLTHSIMASQSAIGQMIKEILTAERNTNKNSSAALADSKTEQAPVIDQPEPIIEPMTNSSQESEENTSTPPQTEAITDTPTTGKKKKKKKKKNKNASEIGLIVNDNGATNTDNADSTLPADDNTSLQDEPESSEPVVETTRPVSESSNSQPEELQDHPVRQDESDNLFQFEDDVDLPLPDYTSAPEEKLKDESVDFPLPPYQFEPEDDITTEDIDLSLPEFQPEEEISVEDDPTIKNVVESPYKDELAQIREALESDLSVEETPVTPTLKPEPEPEPIPEPEPEPEPEPKSEPKPQPLPQPDVFAGSLVRKTHPQAFKPINRYTAESSKAQSKLPHSQAPATPQNPSSSLIRANTPKVSIEPVSLDSIEDAPVSLDEIDLNTPLSELQNRVDYNQLIEPEPTSVGKSAPDTERPVTEPWNFDDERVSENDTKNTSQNTDDEWEWEYVEDDGNGNTDDGDWEWEYVEDGNGNTDDSDWEWEYVEDDSDSNAKK